MSSSISSSPILEIHLHFYHIQNLYLIVLGLEFYYLEFFPMIMFQKQLILNLLFLGNL